MNPFDLRGPAFLLFYVLFSALVAGAVVLVRRQLESGEVPRLPFVDPYLIAQLRAGATEAVRVATLSLLDRGLIEQLGDSLRAAPEADAHARRPIERAVLSHLALKRPARELVADRRLLRDCAPLSAELAELGLYASAAQYWVRAVVLGLALLLLWSVTYTKISLAIARGHHNVQFLVVLTIGVSIGLALYLARRRTPIGDALLRDLSSLFEGLRDRAASLRTGGETNELALLVAVFGMAELEGSARTQAEVLFPRAMANHSGNSSGSCGSSCSSSSSCSSGGCGGGGGCGGCGS